MSRSNKKSQQRKASRTAATAPRSKIFFPLLPSPLECLRTMRSYFRHNRTAHHVYAVFVGKQLRYWSIGPGPGGAENWASRMLWDTYTIELVARDLTITAVPTRSRPEAVESWMSSNLVKPQYRTMRASAGHAERLS